MFSLIEGKTNSTLQLVGGKSPAEGYLLYNKGSVCPDAFGLLDANVVCKELCGAGAYGSVLRGRPHFGPSVANLAAYPYRTAQFDCAGHEDSIDSCPVKVENVSCKSTHGVGISCYDTSSGVEAGIYFNFNAITSKSKNQPSNN